MKRRQPVKVKKFNADELTPSFTGLLKKLAKTMSKDSKSEGAAGIIALAQPSPQPSPFDNYGSDRAEGL